MDDMQAREAVAEAGRRLLHSGLVARTWGNVSCRTGTDSYVITPSGLGYDVMTADDVVPYRMTDGSFSGARKPSSEKGVHTAAYRRFPEAGFIIHTHQCYASALSLAGFERLTLSAEDDTLIGGVALAAYGLPGTKTLVRHVETALNSGAHCVFMAHHGVLITGRDAREAFVRAERLETLCRAVCQGQPEEEEAPVDAASLFALTAQAEARFGHAAFTAAPAVIAVSRIGAVPAQLDDAAQMIGAHIPLAAPDKLLAALQKYDAALVKGLGAVCRARTEGDLDALKLLVEKSCISFLHARACGINAHLSLLDTTLMRRVYVSKYEKKIGG